VCLTFVGLTQKEQSPCCLMHLSNKFYISHNSM